MLVTSSGPAGTRVVDKPPRSARSSHASEKSPLPGLFRDFDPSIVTFQIGIPAQDDFPFKTWSRVLTTTTKTTVMSPASFPDPRGEFELRQEIAAYIAIARGIACTPSQIFVTTGYGGALGAAIHALQLVGSQAWVENPGYPITRTALTLSGLTSVPITVDSEGIDVESAIRAAPDAALAVISPGQQAPLGMRMSLQRRRALLEWAARSKAWIIEDDYLGELQLKGRAAPALAANDHTGRVIHVGTFSKTISPTLRLGFVIVPGALAGRFGEAAASIMPAPSPFVQSAVAEFLRGGQYLRHLRKMKRLYTSRRDALLNDLANSQISAFANPQVAGLSILISLPAGVSDVAIAATARKHGLAPTPLSDWYDRKGVDPPVSGLLLSVTNYGPNSSHACGALANIISGAG